MKYCLFFIFLGTLNLLHSQTKTEVEALLVEIEELIPIVREISLESSSQDLTNYTEKKLSFIEPGLLNWKPQLQAATDADAGLLAVINGIFLIYSKMVKDLNGLANLYLRTEFLLDRNSDALERAQEMVEPDNYLGLNQIQGGVHFYEVHALGLGFDSQKDKMAIETAPAAVDNGGSLTAAMDNSNRSMEFIQKAMSIAREEESCRRFLEQVDKGIEVLEEMEDLDEEFFEELDEDYSNAEETYSLNNFKLATRQYEELLKKINDYLLSKNHNKIVSEKKSKTKNQRLNRWSAPVSYKVKGGINYFKSSDGDLDDETKSVIAGDTAGGGATFFQRDNQSPYNYFGGLEIKKKQVLAGKKFQILNAAEYSSFNIKDQLSMKLSGPSFSLSNYNEIKHNSVFTANSYLRTKLKSKKKWELPFGSGWGIQGEGSGELFHYYKDNAANDPSNQRAKIELDVVKQSGMRGEVSAGTSFELRNYNDDRRSYTSFGFPIEATFSLARKGNLIWTVSPIYKSYKSQEISKRWNILSYGILSYPIYKNISFSLVNDLDYLLYDKTIREFRKDRINQATTLRLSYVTGKLNFSVEYHLDWIHNNNANNDSLYHFNLNENQLKNRIGVNGYLVLYKSLAYSSKLSLGILPGTVNHTFAEDEFYKNMVLSQTYLTFSQSIKSNIGIDVSLTHDAGFLRNSFSLTNPDRDNIFLGVNFYATF